MKDGNYLGNRLITDTMSTPIYPSICKRSFVFAFFDVNLWCFRFLTTYNCRVRVRLKKLCIISAGLRPGTEYGMGVTAIKDEKESPPTTTNAVTGKMMVWYYIKGKGKKSRQSLTDGKLKEALNFWQVRDKSFKMGSNKMKIQ